MSKRPQDGRHSQIKPKDLVGIPWRVAFALQADGWYLRSDIIWSKPNPMPESVTDRPTKSHEYVFLLTKSARYFFDQEAVREEHSAAFRSSGANALRGQAEIRPRGNLASVDEQSYNPSGRNIRSVWTIATQPFPDAHFATYPEELVERCIKAGSRQDDTVLDPFTGSGTTGVVALNLGRSFVGVELNPTYVAMAERRIANVAPLLAEVTTHNAPETHQDAPQTTFPDFP
jgi:DNA modification methylase